jgi:hypothetical protein
LNKEDVMVRAGDLRLGATLLITTEGGVTVKAKIIDDSIIFGREGGSIVMIEMFDQDDEIVIDEDCEPPPQDLLDEARKWAPTVGFILPQSLLDWWVIWEHDYPGLSGRFYLEQISLSRWNWIDGNGGWPQGWPQELKDFYERLDEYEKRDCPLLQ